MNKRDYTLAELKTQKAKEKAIEALMNCKSRECSLEEVKEATIAALMFQREHRLGLYYLYGSDAYYTFCEALMNIYGYKEYKHLMDKASKKVEALREQYPI